MPDNLLTNRSIEELYLDKTQVLNSCRSLHSNTFQARGNNPIDYKLYEALRYLTSIGLKMKEVGRRWEIQKKDFQIFGTVICCKAIVIPLL